MKIYVFVDNNQNVVSIIPAPTLPVSSKSENTEEGMAFGGSESTQKDSRLKCYELDSEADLSIDLNRFEVTQLHQRASDFIKSRSDLRSIELL